MSDEDRETIIGRLIESRANTRYNIGLIRAEVYAISETLGEISARVQAGDIPGARAAFETGHRILKGDLSRFDSRLVELELLTKRLADLEQQIKDLKIE